MDDTINRSMPHLRRMIVGIFVVALALRLMVFAAVADEPGRFYYSDSPGYERRALNLLNYGVFADEEHPPLKPDLLRTPAYPALMAAVFVVAGYNVAFVVVLQIFFGALTAVLAFLTARELRLPSASGLLAAAIVAIDPLSVMTSNHLITETFFTMLSVAGIWLLARYWHTERLNWLLASAVALALASLTRPIGQFLPFVLLPLFALAAKQARLRAVVTAGILFVFVSTLLTYSWAYRNYQVAGIWSISTAGEHNLLYYHAREVLATAERTSQKTALEKLKARINATVAEHDLTATEKSALEREEALAIFKQYPGITLVMLVKGAGRLIADPGYNITCTMFGPIVTIEDGCVPGKATMNEAGVVQKAMGIFRQMSLLQQATLISSLLLLGLLYFGALLGTWRLVRERQWLVLALLVIVIGYFIGLSLGAETYSRMRVPVVPFLAILAGVGLNWLRLHSRSVRRAPAVLAAPSRPAEQL